MADIEMSDQAQLASNANAGATYRSIGSAAEPQPPSSAQPMDAEQPTPAAQGNGSAPKPQPTGMMPPPMRAPPPRFKAPQPVAPKVAPSPPADDAETAGAAFWQSSFRMESHKMSTSCEAVG